MFRLRRCLLPYRRERTVACIEIPRSHIQGGGKYDVTVTSKPQHRNIATTAQVGMLEAYIKSRCPQQTKAQSEDENKARLVFVTRPRCHERENVVLHVILFEEPNPFDQPH